MTIKSENPLPRYASRQKSRHFSAWDSVDISSENVFIS